MWNIEVPFEFDFFYLHLNFKLLQLKCVLAKRKSDVMSHPELMMSFLRFDFNEKNMYFLKDNNYNNISIRKLLYILVYIIDYYYI